MGKTGLVILLLLALATLSLGVSREYRIVQQLETWSGAQSYCREHFADLATIETAEDWARLKTVLEGAASIAWIGLHDDIHGWRWSADDTYLHGDGNTDLGGWFDFVNQGRYQCVEVIGSRLYDGSCNTQQNSVCHDESTNTYIAVTVPQTWWSAQRHCREKYTDLTSMRSQQEKEAIMSVIDGQSHWWVGLSRVTWGWSDRSYSSYRQWWRAEPNGGGEEKCVGSLMGGWADLPCGYKIPFICSVPLMKLLKVEVKAEGSVDLNDPPVQEAVLNRMEKHMRHHGINQKFRLSWRKQPNGKIFNERKG